MDLGVDTITDRAQCGKVGVASPQWQGAQANYVPVSPLVIRLKMLEICGPSNAKMAMTTMATKTRINAYSTKP